MKTLTKEEYDSLGQFNSSINQALSNGETGYCKDNNTIIVCCGNCGNYSRIKLDNVATPIQSDLTDDTDDQRNRAGAFLAHPDDTEH